MSQVNRVETVLSAFGARAGLGELKLDDDGRLTLLIDQIPVTFAYSADPVELLWLYVGLGEVEDGMAAFLLALGFVTWANNRMTIALDRDARKALGYTVIPVAALDVDSLQKGVTVLVESARPIRDRLASGAYEVDWDNGSERGLGVDETLRA
ncbi:MAG: type III secretion system chaperone [Pseudomonadota bacterium]